MPSKYHGAFAGFGLNAGLALSSNGALISIDNAKITANRINATTNSLNTKLAK